MLLPLGSKCHLPTFSKHFVAVSTDLGLIFLLGAIWRVERLEGDSTGNVQRVKTTSCSFIFSCRLLSKTFTPPLLALGLSKSLLWQIILPPLLPGEMIAEFAICRNYMASL